MLVWVSDSQIRCRASASPGEGFDALRNGACIDQNAGVGFERPEMARHGVLRYSADVEFAIGHRSQKEEFTFAYLENVVDWPRERGRSNNSPIDPQAPHLPYDAKGESIPDEKLPWATLALHGQLLARDRLFDLWDR